MGPLPSHGPEEEGHGRPRRLHSPQAVEDRKEDVVTNMAPAPGLLLAAQKPVSTLDQEMVLFSHRWLQKTASHFGWWGGLAGREGSWVVGAYLLGSFGFSHFLFY